MRNDNQRWDAPAPLSRDMAGMTITEITLSSQHWVSGPDVLDRYAKDLIGWPGTVGNETYALALRRDRVLVVGDTDLTAGYSAITRLAITDISDAYTVLDLTGPKAFDNLRRGGEIRLDQPSRSVMRRLFGYDVVLYCLGKEKGFRLHITRSHAQSFVGYLST